MEDQVMKMQIIGALLVINKLELEKILTLQLHGNVFKELILQ